MLGKREAMKTERTTAIVIQSFTANIGMNSENVHFCV